MIRRITAYGDPRLRQQSEDINPDYPGLDVLIADMFETMYSASGVGLAAPQIGLSINLFIIDTTRVDNYPEGKKLVFINPEILEESGKLWKYEEGCLSLPGIREDVERLDTVTIRYLDENFKEQTETFTGINGRVIQHEYDHLLGVLFIDLIPPLRKRLIRKKLDAILKGTADAGYPINFYRAKKR
ncbi:MAG TPA: peptide deformylase [Bacteroidia bacterium]|nr:peptide deformylase [Bacteroidia bacterium]HRS58372.1 peptide deformylase [Bacteroidia bacterium]HRU67322.1 peptide deformylase [Bacteroidia bacterium]